jgi:hypothetical protein
MPSTKKFNRDKDETKYWRILTTIISGGLKIWYRQGFKTNQFFLAWEINQFNSIDTKKSYRLLSWKYFNSLES